MHSHYRFLAIGLLLFLLVPIHYANAGGDITNPAQLNQSGYLNFYNILRNSLPYLVLFFIIIILIAIILFIGIHSGRINLLSVETAILGFIFGVGIALFLLSFKARFLYLTLVVAALTLITLFSHFKIRGSKKNKKKLRVLVFAVYLIIGLVIGFLVLYHVLSALCFFGCIIG